MEADLVEGDILNRSLFALLLTSQVVVWYKRRSLWNFQAPMELSGIDIFTFVAFLCAVVSISLYASRKGDSAEDYFLAGRGLSWWLIGFSLIASNISTEHFIGMAGKGYGLGLAIASFEWLSAPVLVFIALVLLPKFLRAGIYTMPEYLEYRFGPTARTIMAAYFMVMYVVAAMAGVLYSGGLALQSIFGVDLYLGVWMIGILAGAYTVYGGLKAVVWSDLLQGITLLLGGAIVLGIGLSKVGGVGSFLAANEDKLHLALPYDHPEYPWTILLLGMWIPQLGYWGFNQFITQRTLAAKSLLQGQKGVLFAASLKLLIPLFVVFPGIMAAQLYGAEIQQGDLAFPFLVKKLLPAGLRGIIFAALLGAVMSSLDSMLNSASTIFTIDIYNRHFVKGHVGGRQLITVGRIATAVFVIFACILAPELRHSKSIYDYMQQVWSFVWPGTVAVFLLGIFYQRVPQGAAVLGMLFSPLAYVVSFLVFDVVFLNASAIALVLTCLVMLAYTWWRPLTEVKKLPVRADIDLRTTPQIKVAGGMLVLATVAIYIYFW